MSDSNNTDALKRLASVVDSYFKPSFLYDAYHCSWRQRVSPAEGTPEYINLTTSADGNGVVPPLVRFSSVIAYDDVHSAAKATLPEGDSSSVATAADNKLVAAVREAVTTFSKLVTFVEDAAVGPCLRRNEMLSEDDNPIRRTVHMKPIHQNASEEDVRAFVVQQLSTKLKGQPEELLSKLILNISKRTFVDVSANGLSRNVFYAQIEFIKKDTATLFVALKPSYASSDPVSQHYLPQLKVVMLEDHLRAYEEYEARREAERTKQALFRATQQQEQRQEAHQLLEAKKAAAAAAASGPSSSAVAANQSDQIGGTIQVTEQFLTRGKTLKVVSLPPNVTWRDVKVKLSNLFPDEKRLIRVVKEHDGSAFVVLFSPDKLEPLLSAWAADTFCHAVVPSLVKVEGDEEKWAIKEYPNWVSGFVTKKVVKNYKTAVKRLRDEE